MDTCDKQECANDCGDHGVCENEKCVCDAGWYGNCCEDPGDERWGGVWSFYRILFAVVFYSVALFALRQLIRGMMLRRSLGCRRILMRLFRSPRNLSVFLIMCAAFFRGLWLSIDPLCFQETMSRLGDRMLYNIVFPLMYCVYCSVLLVWSGLYQSVTNRKELWSKIYRNLIVVVMCLALVMGLAFSACQGLRITNPGFASVAYSVICVSVAFVFSGLLFFGILLNKYIKSVMDDEEQPKQLVVKNTLAPDMESESLELIRVVSEETPLDRPSPPMPSLSRSKSSAATMRTFGIRPTEVELLPASEPLSLVSSGAWSFSSRSIDFQSNESFPRWSEFQSILVSSDTVPRPSRPEPRLVRKKEDYVVVLTRQDKVILRQIILLTIVSAVIGLSVVGFTVLLAINQSLQREVTILGLMFLVCGMEFVAYLTVLFIFTTQIKVRSKENLHFISDIAMRIARNPGKVKLPQGFRAISKRLHLYAQAAAE